MDATNARRLHDPVLREIHRFDVSEGEQLSLLKQYDLAVAGVNVGSALLRMIARSIGAVTSNHTQKTSVAKTR